MLNYKSHKTVAAAKIAEYEAAPDGAFILELSTGETETVTGAWVVKHNPDIENLLGGYFVRYADGYTSWSPAEAFEQGYAVVTHDWLPPSLLSDVDLDEKLRTSPAPRVTKEQIEGRIASHGFLQIGETVIVCQIVLDNGWSVRGEAACVEPSNFDPAVGERIAYDNAFRQLYGYFGFILAEARYQMRRPGFEQVLETAESVLTQEQQAL